MNREAVKRHNVGSIIALEVYNNDVKVRRHMPDKKRDEPKRGRCQAWTDKQTRRLAFVAANTDVVFYTMITLTYPSVYPRDGLVVKRDLKVFLQRCKRHWVDFSYLWFLEFQKRGAPHIHILTPQTMWGDNKNMISQWWYEIVDSSDMLHLYAGTRVERLRRPGGFYAVKYAYKMQQKSVPVDYQNVGRFYGYSKDVKPEASMVISGGEFADIFEGVDGWRVLLENGYSVLFGTAGTVASNAVIKGENMEFNACTYQNADHIYIDMVCQSCGSYTESACQYCYQSEGGDRDVLIMNCPVCMEEFVKGGREEDRTQRGRA